MCVKRGAREVLVVRRGIRTLCDGNVDRVVDWDLVSMEYRFPKDLYDLGEYSGTRIHGGYLGTISKSS